MQSTEKNRNLKWFSLKETKVVFLNFMIVWHITAKFFFDISHFKKTKFKHFSLVFSILFLNVWNTLMQKTKD